MKFFKNLFYNLFRMKPLDEVKQMVMYYLLYHGRTDFYAMYLTMETQVGLARLFRAVEALHEDGRITKHRVDSKNNRYIYLELTDNSHD